MVVLGGTLEFKVTIFIDRFLENLPRTFVFLVVSKMRIRVRRVRMWMNLRGKIRMWIRMRVKVRKWMRMRMWMKRRRGMWLESMMLIWRRYFMILICLIMMSFIVAEQESDVD